MIDQPPDPASPPTPELIERLEFASKCSPYPGHAQLLRAAADALRSTERQLANLCDTCRDLLPFTANAQHDLGNGCWQCALQNEITTLEAQVARLTQERDTPRGQGEKTK